MILYLSSTGFLIRWEEIKVSIISKRNFSLLYRNSKWERSYWPTQNKTIVSSNVTKLFSGEFWRLKHKNFSFCAAQGMRSYMEDRMHYMFDPNHTLSIFGIFDGHGGQFVSEYLEKNFAQSIRKRMIRGETRRRLSNTSTISNDDRVVEVRLVFE